MSSKHRPKTNEIKEEDFTSNELDFEDETEYTQELINEMVDESIYKACTHTASYIQSYRKENSLPFAEFIDFGCISDFILSTGRMR